MTSARPTQDSSHPVAHRLSPDSTLFEAVQTTMRNTFCTLEMLANIYWRDRQSHFLMQSHPGLRACQQATEAVIIQLALMLKSELIRTTPDKAH